MKYLLLWVTFPDWKICYNRRSCEEKVGTIIFIVKCTHAWNTLISEIFFNINEYVKLRQLRVDNEIVTEKWSGSESSARNWERHRRSSKLETCEAIVFLSKISRLGFLVTSWQPCLCPSLLDKMRACSLLKINPTGIICHLQMYPF